MKASLVFVVAATVSGAAAQVEPAATMVTHSQFQAVDADGEQTYGGSEKVTLDGILLHSPADMLDPTPDDSIEQLYDLGGQWQVFFQGEGAPQ